MLHTGKINPLYYVCVGVLCAAMLSAVVVHLLYFHATLFSLEEDFLQLKHGFVAEASI